jgi:hypothetical protein
MLRSRPCSRRFASFILYQLFYTSSGNGLPSRSHPALQSHLHRALVAKCAAHIAQSLLTAKARRRGSQGLSGRQPWARATARRRLDGRAARAARTRLKSGETDAALRFDACSIIWAEIVQELRSSLG